MEGALALDAEEEGAGLHGVGGERAEDLDLLAAHEPHADRRLLVGFQFGLDEEGAGVDLALPPRGLVVPVDGRGRVVQHDQRCLQRHYLKMIQIIIPCFSLPRSRRQGELPRDRTPVALDVRLRTGQVLQQIVVVAGALHR